MSAASPDPIGVVLAGGAGSRLGTAKATARLAGRPLIEYPLAALGQVLGELAIVAKADTELPVLAGVSRWAEPATPRHPLVGIVAALRRAAGRPVIVCAVDLPFVDAATIGALVAAGPGDAAAVVACDRDGGLQPLLARYGPAALDALAAAAVAGSAPMRAVVAALSPVTVTVHRPRVLFNVNTPEDLADAAAQISRR